MTSTVYRVNFENTVDQMFTNTYVLAQSGVAPFENAPAFTGIQPVTAAASGETFMLNNYFLPPIMDFLGQMPLLLLVQKESLTQQIKQRPNGNGYQQTIKPGLKVSLVLIPLYHRLYGQSAYKIFVAPAATKIVGSTRLAA